MQPHMNKREIYAPHSRPRFFASISASCLACTATSGATPRNAGTRGTRGRGWCSRWTIAFPKTVREHFPRPRVPRPFRNPRPHPPPLRRTRIISAIAAVRSPQAFPNSPADNLQLLLCTSHLAFCFMLRFGNDCDISLQTLYRSREFAAFPPLWHAGGLV